MGRRKIEIQPIADERNRTITFVKRKAGLFKKAHELAILCQVDLAVIILNNNNNNYYEFSSCNIDDLLANYKSSSNIYESKGPSSFGAEYDNKPINHKRYSSNNSFSNNESIADDDSDSENEKEIKRHKRSSSEMNSIGRSLLNKVQSANNYNTTNNYNTNRLSFLDSKNFSRGNRHLKSASFSNTYDKSNTVSVNGVSNPVNGANNIITNNNGSLLVGSGTNTQEYLMRPQSTGYIQQITPLLQQQHQSQLQQPQPQPVSQVQSQFQQPQPQHPGNAYAKLPFAAKLNDFEEVQQSSFNGNLNLTAALGKSPVLSSNFVFPPQKLPSLNNFSQMGYSNPATQANNLLRQNVMNSFNNNTINKSLDSLVGKNHVNSIKNSGGNLELNKDNTQAPISYDQSLNEGAKTGSTIETSGVLTPAGTKDEDTNSVKTFSNLPKSSTSVNSNIPYSAASSPAFGHTPRQSSSSRPVLRVKIPEDSDSSVPFNANKGGANKKAQNVSKDKDLSSSPHNQLNPNVNATSSGNTNKSTPISASLPSAMFQFNMPNITSGGSSNNHPSNNNSGSNGNNTGPKNQPSLVTANLPPATGGLLSSSIRPFLFNTGNGEQTPVSGLPSKYMNEFFPSPSNYYGDWNVSGTGETPLRTSAGITLPLPLLNGVNGTNKSSDTSLGKHSLNNPHGSIKDELPSPIVMPTGGLPFGNLTKEKELKKKESKNT